MFTGLVEQSSPVLSLKHKNEGGLSLEVKRPESFSDLERGHSVCVHGACLSVVNDRPSDSDSLFFDLGAETLKVTNHHNLEVGDFVHLERAMKVGQRLHGYIVTGHIDELAPVTEIKSLEGACLGLKISVNRHLECIWPKGSIVINGVSLTINDVDENELSVCLIPETLKKTNLGKMKVGHRVNLEYDFLAKGIVRSAELARASARGQCQGAGAK